MGIDPFITYVLRPDTSWIITGLKGTGKTFFATTLMHEAVERGYHVYTNVHFFEIDQVALAISRNKLPKRFDGRSYRRKPDEIHVCSRLSELLIGLCAPQRKVVVLDEAGIHADSTNALSQSTRNVKNIAKIIRHFDASFGLITQTSGMISPDLRERTLDIEIDIKRVGEQRYISVGKRAERSNDDGTKDIYFPTVHKFGPIPLTTLPVDGKFPSGFEVDIDIKKALDALSHEGNTMDIIEGGRGKIIIEKLVKKKK